MNCVDGCGGVYTGVLYTSPILFPGDRGWVVVVVSISQSSGLLSVKEVMCAESE